MKKSLLIAAALLSTAVAVQAEELFVNIHSGNAMAQGAGLVLAGQALEQKALVRVLLCDAAGDIALVGKDRVSSLLLNVLIPFLAATGEGAAFRAGLLDLLPPEQDNTLVRQTAFSLFGQDHAPSLYRHGLRQQGLIQVFQDYCLNDRSRCASCTLPGLLENYRGKMPS